MLDYGLMNQRYLNMTVIKKRLGGKIETKKIPEKKHRVILKHSEMVVYAYRPH